MSETTLSDKNFEQEVLKSPQPVLVDFFAEWCGPCKIQAPIIEELAEEYKDQIKVGVLDIDQSQEAANKYQVTSIPTLVIFNKGQEVERFMGLQQKGVLKEKLDKLIS